MRWFILVCLLAVANPGPVFAESATDIVTEAYEDVLGRKPDKDGLSTYRSRVIENDWTAEDVRNALRKSDEYADKIITEAYQDVLGRKPDSGAFETFRKKITKKGWSEKRLRKELRDSPEYKAINKK